MGVVALGLLIPISKAKRATYSVLKRNFAAYFSNPTGYVFICVFMLLSSVAAFWPQQFFSRNLADLEQLNLWFPMIMLVFIPAITMSIWAEERHEGTDELLLTIPASDTDIVLGKYLAAVSIYTAALMFSMLTNFLVLVSLSLGDVDIGLFISTYVGYWFIGLAMLALGMVASFLTSNLTIGFLLGACSMRRWFSCCLPIASSPQEAWHKTSPGGAIPRGLPTLAAVLSPWVAAPSFCWWLCLASTSASC